MTAASQLEFIMKHCGIILDPSGPTNVSRILSSLTQGFKVSELASLHKKNPVPFCFIHINRHKSKQSNSSSYLRTQSSKHPHISHLLYMETRTQESSTHKGLFLSLLSTQEEKKDVSCLHGHPQALIPSGRLHFSCACPS